MGLIRKMTSVSTLGGVKYTSKREAQTKAAVAQARAADQEAKLLKAQRKTETKERQVAAAAEKWEPVVAAIEAGEASWDDLTGMQKLSMPISYQLRCKAAARRQKG